MKKTYDSKFKSRVALEALRGERTKRFSLLRSLSKTSWKKESQYSSKAHKPEDETKKIIVENILPLEAAQEKYSEELHE